MQLVRLMAKSYQGLIDVPFPWGCALQWTRSIGSGLQHTVKLIWGIGVTLAIPVSIIVLQSFCCAVL